MKKWLLIPASFLLGSISYVLGFVVVGTLGDLLVNFAIILPPIVDPLQVGITASAIGANGFAIWTFSKITREEHAPANLAFCIYLIVLSTIYLVAAIFSWEIHLLWYPALSYIINGIEIKAIMEGIISTKGEKSLALEGILSKIAEKESEIHDAKAILESLHMMHNKAVEDLGDFTESDVHKMNERGVIPDEDVEETINSIQVAQEMISWSSLEIENSCRRIHLMQEELNALQFERKQLSISSKAAKGG